MHLLTRPLICTSNLDQPRQTKTKKSATFVPGIEQGERFAFLDCPGFLDNRGAEINIANAVNIKFALHMTASVKIIILINYYSLEADRGRGQRELVAILRDLFGSTENIIRCAPSILLGVSQVTPKVLDDDEVVLTQLDDIQAVFGECKMLKSRDFCSATKRIIIVHCDFFFFCRGHEWYGRRHG